MRLEVGGLRRAVGTATTALGLLLALPGCSFIFVDTVPDNHARMSSFDCTSGKVAPVLDTIFAGFEVVRTAVALSADESDYGSYPISRGADIGFGVAFSALFIASAAYGYSETSACSDAERALGERRFEQERTRMVTPTPYYPQTPPPAPVQTVGCSHDAQCKGDRVCEQGRCVSPAPVQPMQAPIAPAQGPQPGPEVPPPPR